MRILCFIQGHEFPSARVRVLNLEKELQAAGVETQIATLPGKFFQRLRWYGRCRKFDAVLLQKKLLSDVDVALLRVFARRLVFDFDDAIYYRHDAHDSLESPGRKRKFAAIVRAADLVVAGNEVLATAARQYNPRVTVLPSAVEVQDVPFRSHTNSTPPIRIGWIGGVNNLIHIQALAGVLLRLAKAHDIELRIISGDRLDIPGLKVRFIPWSLGTQEQELAQLDIGVMPLPHNVHTEGKCAYKALQYMAAGVPPVVSDVGANRSVVINGESGYVAETDEDFYAALLKLADDVDLRQMLGANARARAAKYYSVPVLGQRLARELLNLQEVRVPLNILG